MIVSVDVYTKDVDAALAIYKKAIEEGAKSVNLVSSEDYDTKEFEHLNLMFEGDHSLGVIALLDEGPFCKDTDDL